MCRLAAHTGATVPLSALLYDPPHALDEMSWQPRELQHGTINVDGTGIAWWDDPDGEPMRYVTPSPPWSDANLPTLAPRLSGTTMLGAVRGATPGIAYGPGNVAPYVARGLAFAHNGWLGDYRAGVRRDLEAGLADDTYHLSAAVSDSITLFQVLLDHHRDTGDLETAVRRTIATAVKVCAAHDAPATLNLAVSDGQRVVASRAHRGLRGNSLYTLVDDDGAWLASEAMHPDCDWTPVPEDHVVVLEADTVSVSRLEVSA